VPTDLILNPFSRYGKRIAWEEVEWLAANGRRQLKAQSREPHPDPVALIAQNNERPPLPDLVESPLLHPFKVLVRPDHTAGE
jgi:hypothetical protein